MDRERPYWGTKGLKHSWIRYCHETFRITTSVNTPCQCQSLNEHVKVRLREYHWTHE